MCSGRTPIRPEANCPGTRAGVSVPAITAPSRPEHITLGRDHGVPAVVDAIEYLGGDSLITCHVGRQVLAVRVPGNVALRRGDATTLAWAPGAQHLFDAEGKRYEMPESNERATMLA